MAAAAAESRPQQLAPVVLFIFCLVSSWGYGLLRPECLAVWRIMLRYLSCVYDRARRRLSACVGGRSSDSALQLARAIQPSMGAG